MLNWFTSNWKEYKGLILFLILMTVFRSALADWNEVPTGSMKPTILEGDRILVNKMAYDLRIPFSHTALIKLSDPERGDIVVFDSKAANLRLVKRVVGVPGDVLQMNNNQLTINGQLLQYKTINAHAKFDDLSENLLGLKHKIRVGKAGSTLSSFDRIKIPANYYLVLGDNRDNSADSRVIGLVPRDEIIGRAKTVVMSLNYANYYAPRRDRFFHTL